MASSRTLRRVGAAATVAVCLAFAPQAVAAGSNGLSGAAAREQAQRDYHHGTLTPDHGDLGDDGDLAASLDAYGYERSAPAGSAPGAAVVAARQQAAALPVHGGSWNELTNVPYNAVPAGYTDPFWDNVGSGFGVVGGRTTALAAGVDGTWFAGTADGGVWRSSDRGAHWTPTFDTMPSLSIGALTINPTDHSLWVGTGESNTSQDAYAGVGVYRSTDDGHSYQLVGGKALQSHTIFRITFARDGSALAATNDGLWRLTSLTGTWKEVLDPAGANQNPPYPNQISDVALRPGADAGAGQIIAAVGWRGPLTTPSYNGFYVSRDNGATFTKVNPTGAINVKDIGRTSFAYSSDGSVLYAVVESPSALAAGKESVLQGVFRSDNGKVSGPWTKVADEAKLAASGSALAVGSGYGVGVQAWYNQALTVDPVNPMHIYVDLEEVFESTNGGDSWVTASPYWNYGLACGKKCPNTTHPDQHAVMVTGGKVVIGNDGGVYSRAVTNHQQYGGWSDLNNTLHDLQYYDAREGNLPNGLAGRALWGGLQDNGTSVLQSGASQMAEPAGGDGFYVIVDPSNAQRAVGEYTGLTMYSTTDGGTSFTSDVSPGCDAQATVGLTPRADCDPGARFVAPFVADQATSNTWIAGGEDVWVSNAGWSTHCNPTACSWRKVYDTGAGNAVTALSAVNGVTYAAWVGGGGNPGPGFGRGIATNFGGTWHDITTPNLPNRFIAGVTVDPADPAHAYAIFNGFSRRWIPGGGIGHVYETKNGGTSWLDISGNLPDTASNALVIVRHTLVLGTDTGAFTATAGQGTATKWANAGSGLPNASVNNLTLAPDGVTVVAATHGRGVWSLTVN